MRFCREARRRILTFIEIIDAFTFYGLDIALLAGLTTGVTQLVKILLFKKRTNKKLVTLLPFLIGTLAYAVYACVRNLSFAYVLREYTSVVEHGIAVGSLSTLWYVLYEQFVREKKGLSATERIISTLIEGYVPDDALEQTAKAVAEAISRDVTGNGAERTREILASATCGEIDERDVTLLSKLIIETLAHITTA